MPKGNTAQPLSCNPIKNGITQLRFTEKACESQVIKSLIKLGKIVGVYYILIIAQNTNEWGFKHNLTLHFCADAAD